VATSQPRRAAADYLAVRGVLRGERPLPEFDADDERLKWIRYGA